MIVAPQVQFLEFDKTVDPSGFRHIPGSSLGVLDTSTTGYLDFGNSNVSISGVVSATKMAIFRVSDMADASGIYNMRFYLKSATAFSAGQYRFLHNITTHFQGAGYSLTTLNSDIPSSIPSSANLLSTDGQGAMSGTQDDNVSQYIYLAVFTDTDVPYGTKGGGGAGSFRFSCVYDFS